MKLSQAEIKEAVLYWQREIDTLEKEMDYLMGACQENQADTEYALEKLAYYKARLASLSN